MEGTSGIKSQGKLIPQNDPKPLHTFHCLCSKKRMENLVEATASFKIIFQGWTGLFLNDYRSGFYFNNCREVLWDQISACVTQLHMASHLEYARLPRHDCNEREYESVPACLNMNMPVRPCAVFSL